MHSFFFDGVFRFLFSVSLPLEVPELSNDSGEFPEDLEGVSFPFPPRSFLVLGSSFFSLLGTWNF